MSKIIQEFEVSGKTLTLETGSLAKNASAAVVATFGQTVVLATVCHKTASEEIDYFPLTVDYEERLYAGGRISTSRFIKREGRPSEKAVLTGRLIDRPIRPLFPKDYAEQVQVIVTVLSVDQENDPDVLSIIAVSAALSISEIPWNGPIAAVRVGYKDGSYVANPTSSEMEFSDLDLIVSSTSQMPVMMEANANEMDEKIIIGGVEFSQKINSQIVNEIIKFTNKAGKQKIKFEAKKIDDKIGRQVKKIFNSEFAPTLNDPENINDETWFEKTKEKLFEKFSEGADVSKKLITSCLEHEVKNYFRSQIVLGKRPDGRKIDEIRPITVEVGVLPRTHGSAIFTRGSTQILSIVTLGSPALQQLIEGMDGEKTKRYMHHYNFPPFSTGEVKRAGSPGRREIGHGALAERALLPEIPGKDGFPYVIRVVSEVMSSSGSTSMGSVCGSSLALMDAGVPIKAPVAGIAIGLISEKDKNIVLSDIAYAEDANGDMDFKVAGTASGITSIQLDMKISGISFDILSKALDKAREGRLHILKKMLEIIPSSRQNLSPFAPRVTVINIDPSRIGEVIGGGGKTINNIIAQTGAAIDIENDGTVTIAAKDPESSQKAVEWIKLLTREIKSGEIFAGTVKRILPFGAMVEILPGKEGLVHVSQLASHRVNRVEDVVQVGQEVTVKVSEIDNQGRTNLTMLIDSKDENFRDRQRQQVEKKKFGQRR